MGDISIARGVSPSFGNKKHGTRETGDRRRSSMICNRFPSSGLRPSVSAEAPPRQDAVTGCHPFHGFQLPFLFLRGVPHPTLPRGVLHRLAMGMSPVSRALNAARLRLAKFQFVEQIGASSKMSLMFLLLTKSLGHLCTRPLSIPFWACPNAPWGV